MISHTTKPDKYDRYLADVFASAADGSISQLSALDSQLDAGGGDFANNALLEHGYAERKDEWELAIAIWNECFASASRQPGNIWIGLPIVTPRPLPGGFASLQFSNDRFSASLDI